MPTETENEVICIHGVGPDAECADCYRDLFGEMKSDGELVAIAAQRDWNDPAYVADRARVRTELAVHDLDLKEAVEASETAWRTGVERQVDG